eukprot:2440040-Amphidinium_carterae.1
MVDHVESFTKIKGDSIKRDMLVLFEMGDEVESLLLSTSTRPIGGLLGSEAALQPWAKREDDQSLYRTPKTEIGLTLVALFWPALGMGVTQA